MPSHRERLIKALRAPKKKQQPVYTAKPSVYAVGPPPVREASVGPVTVPFAGNPDVVGVDAPMFEAEQIPELLADFAPIVQPPPLTTPVTTYSNEEHTPGRPVEYEDVEVGGRLIRVPRQYTAGPPPVIRPPGVAPVIDERAVQASRNRGGQNVGIMAALASLFGADSGYLGENIPAIMAQGIEGGEQGELDRYARQVNNYQMGEATRQAANQADLDQYKLQSGYADALNQAASAPAREAERILGIEDDMALREIQRQRIELQKLGITNRESARGFQAFQKFDTAFRKAPPALRETMLTDEYLRAYGVGPSAAETYRSQVNANLSDPAEMQKLGRAFVDDVFRQLSDPYVSEASKEELYASLPELAKTYSLDLSALPAQIDALRMSPEASLRLHIAMLRRMDTRRYNDQKNAYMRGLLSEKVADRKLKAFGLIQQINREAKNDYGQFSKAMADLLLGTAMAEDYPDLAAVMVEIARNQASRFKTGSPEQKEAKALQDNTRRFFDENYPGLLPPDIGEKPKPGKPPKPPGVNPPGGKTGGGVPPVVPPKDKNAVRRAVGP